VPVGFAARAGNNGVATMQNSTAAVKAGKIRLKKYWFLFIMSRCLLLGVFENLKTQIAQCVRRRQRCGGRFRKRAMRSGQSPQLVPRRGRQRWRVMRKIYVRKISIFVRLILHHRKGWGKCFQMSFVWIRPQFSLRPQFSRPQFSPNFPFDPNFPHLH